MAAAAAALFFFGLFHCYHSFQLHSVMDAPELMHYFQTTNAGKVPEYQIVNLPKDAEVDAFGDEIAYEFTAFDR